MRALLLENLHPEASRILTEAGVAVDARDAAMEPDELARVLPGYQLLGIRSTTEVTAEALRSAPDLLAVGAFCIGTNQVDLAAAAAQGVAVFNAPFSNTRSVVELVIGEIIALARRLTDRDRALHQGRWEKSAKGSHEIRGRRLGIVGYGNIGSQLSVVAEALGMQVYFYDREDKLALGNARRCDSLDELLDVAEAVTLHVDGRQGNAGFFGVAQFARMRPRSLFLNLSRGFVVDYAALREQLLAGHIAGAAVDVFPDEPKAAGDEFVSELRGLSNVILTPHIGGSTQEAQEDIGRFVAGKLRDFVESGATTLSVNLPGLTLPARGQGQRLVHVHRNVPGVLAAVDRVLAEDGINIDGQLLATRGALGYVACDVSSPIGATTVAALESMPEMVRVRVLRQGGLSSGD